MRKDWEVKTWNEVLSIINGKNQKHVEDSNGIYPIYGSGGIMGYANDFLCPNNTVIIGRKGNINKPIFVEEKFWNVDTAFGLVPKEGILVAKYLFYYCVNYDFEKLNKAVTIPSLTKSDLLNIKIALPPYLTQQQIVEELDCLTSIIEKQKKQLEELDNLAQAIFYDMFGDPIKNEKGWETSTIDNVCLSIIRGPFGSALKKEFFVEKDDSTYKVYEQKNAINKNAFIGTYYISKEMYKSLSRFEVFPNDIIMSCSGTIGELYVIPYEAERGIINQALLKFTLNKKIERDYFLFMMNQMKSKMDVKGCGIQNIGSVKYIKATVFGLPPLPLQQQFASKIEAIEKQKELIKKSIKETEDLFNSRMDYYFN